MKAGLSPGRVLPRKAVACRLRLTVLGKPVVIIGKKTRLAMADDKQLTHG